MSEATEKASPTRTSVLARWTKGLRDVLLLERNEALNRRLEDGQREPIQKQLAASRQRLRAAELLWAQDAPAEALRLAVEALRDAARALDLSAEALAVEPKALLPECGLRGRRLERVLAARAGLDAVEVAALDADVDADGAALFKRLATAAAHLANALHPIAMPRARARSARRLRKAALIVAGCLLVVAAYFVLRTPRGVEARASGYFGPFPTYAPDNVVDGNSASEWVLPERQTGWVELALAPARTVTEVRVLNAHNPPYNDRATKNYRVDLLRQGQVVATQDGLFETIEPNAEWAQHTFDSVLTDRIRVVVISYHGRSGGMAEVEFDEAP